MTHDSRRRSLLAATLASLGLGPVAARAAAARGARAAAVAGAPACGQGLARPSAATPRWRHYARGRYGQVHVFSTAPAAAAVRARPLVCLHPSPTSGEMFTDLAAELAADRIVHCPDTPGFGASDAPPAKPTVADYGGALGDALADLGYGDERSPLGPVDLFGFHTGSLCAVELALQRPGMVRRLALAGVPHYEAAQRERERASHVRPYPYFEERDYVGEMFRRLVLDARDSGEPEQRLRRFGDRLRAGRNGWWGPDAVFTYDSVAALPRLALPTLFIAFNEEMAEPTRAASRLVAGARLVEMLDLPIFGFIVDPRRVAATLKSFFDAPQPQRTV